MSTVSLSTSLQLGRHALALAAGVRTRLVARRLRDFDRAVADQRQVWSQLMRGYAATEYGRTHGITSRVTYAQFRDQVPPCGYVDLAPAIERMKRGEESVLWPGRCQYYALSSGTTAGRTKYLPVTSQMLAHFRRTGLDSLCFYAQRAGSLSVFRGRHLFLGGSTALERLPGAASFQPVAGDLSGITALNLPGWTERYWYEPGRRIAQIDDWPDKLRAIAERTIDRDIRLLAGIPSWILVFAETMRLISGQPTLKDVWPRLECLIHGGVPVGPFSNALREAMGPGVAFHEVYPASEAFVAAQDGAAAEGLRLLTDAGIFYEFVPMAAFDATRLSELGAAVLPLWEVEPNIDYAILLTTPAGLCRYVLGDVVRFVTTNPPRLQYVGRTQLQLSAFGEHVLEKEVTDALTAACARHGGLAIVNFHVAPRFQDGSVGAKRGCHEWWIEFRPGEAARVSPSVLAGELDTELRRRNDDYEGKRRGGGLNRPEVNLVPSGTFESWLKRHGRWGGQNKMPRCRSDRAVASELDSCLIER